jgi:hypothetical protein
MDGEDYQKSARALGNILDESLRRASLENICVKAVRSEVNAQLGEEDWQKPISPSLLSNLLWAMAKAASDHAFERGIDPDDFEVNVLPKAVAVVLGLRSALVRDWNDRTINFWDDVESPVNKIKADKVPYIDRSSL